MNIQNKYLDKLDQLLKDLNLSAQNRRIAEDYLLAETPDETLLAQAEAHSFRLIRMNTRVLANQILEPLREGKNTELLARFYKLWWAMGKSTATYLLSSVFHTRTDTSQWRFQVLGKAAVAAMDAERICETNNPYMIIPTLWKLAQSEPETLSVAKTYCGEPIEGRMQVLLSGLLLSCPHLSPEMVSRQVDAVLRGNFALMPTVMHSLPGADRKLLAAYIQEGNPTASLPQLSSDQYYATNVGHFWQTFYTDDKSAGLLGSAAILAQRHDPRARCAARVHLALNPRIVMMYATQLIPRDYLLEELPRILEDLPGGKASMLLFLTANYPWMDEPWRKKIALLCADALAEVLPKADPNQYFVLSQLLPDAVKSMGLDAKGEITRFLANALDSGEDELRDYLEDTGSLAHSAKQLKNVSFTGYNHPYQVARMIQGYRQAHGWDDFSQRCAVVLGLVFKGYSLRILIAKEQGALDPDALTGMCRTLQENGLPLTEHLNLLGNYYETVYADSEKKAVQNCATALLITANDTAEICRAAKEGNLFARQHAVYALSRLNTQEAKQGLLACTNDSAKAIRNLLLELLPGHPDWAPEYIEMLKSKKAAQRILAATVLGKLGAVGVPALQQALETEKSAKVADAIQSALGDSAKPPVTGREELAQRLLSNNKVRKLQWMLGTPLPAVRLNGEAKTDAGEHLIHAMLVSYCELGRIGRSDSATQISEGMDPRDLEALADEVFERWMAAGAPSKHKWVLAFSAVYGGETVSRKLIRAINDWPQNARGAIACDGVKALTLSSAPGALLAVDAISRKFKFRQVKTAAAEALDRAAQEMGITAEELADRIVPDLGFDESGKRVFDYGKRSFTVRLTAALELEITNDAGKPVKSLPAPGKTDNEQTATDAYEQFKTMKKQIRTTVNTQKARLEAALVSLRCWDTDRWQALFVRNPIMHQFAISLIWGVYRNGQLTDTFRYMEDGSFNTVDEEEYALPGDASIGLVHPVDLDGEMLSAWKQQLEDYEVTQSIQQLDRPVYTMDPALRECRVLEAFGGKKLNGLSLSGKMTGQGWYRGSVVDGGAFYTYWREDPSLDMGVELRFSGSYIGDENEDVTVYDAVFYKSGTVTRGSYNYDAPKEENIFSLGQIPPRYYSEIIQQLTKATASSTETDPDWKSDRKDQ